MEIPDPGLTRSIIGAAIEVHRALGAGLLESVYERCLAHELGLREIPFKQQVVLPLEYKGLELDSAYRLDLLVSGRVVVEVKAVEGFLAVHEAQALTYLKLSGLRLALLINFNVPRLTDGVRRIVL